MVVFFEAAGADFLAMLHQSYAPKLAMTFITLKSCSCNWSSEKLNWGSTVRPSMLEKAIDAGVGRKPWHMTCLSSLSFYWVQEEEKRLATSPVVYLFWMAGNKIHPTSPFIVTLFPWLRAPDFWPAGVWGRAALQWSPVLSGKGTNRWSRWKFWRCNCVWWAVSPVHDATKFHDRLF